MSKCNCTVAIRVNGEGCRYCQPQTYIEFLSETLDEVRAELADRELLVKRYAKRTCDAEAKIAALEVEGLAKTPPTAPTFSWVADSCEAKQLGGLATYTAGDRTQTLYLPAFALASELNRVLLDAFRAGQADSKQTYQNLLRGIIDRE
jgi:hypothetical protein